MYSRNNLSRVSVVDLVKIEIDGSPLSILAIALKNDQREEFVAEIAKSLITKYKRDNTDCSDIEKKVIVWESQKAKTLESLEKK